MLRLKHRLNALKRGGVQQFQGSGMRLFSGTNVSLSTEERRAKYIVETQEVQQLIEDGQEENKLRLINATWSPPGGGFDAISFHEKQRLTDRTQYFSISEVADKEAKLAKTMPSAEVFRSHLRTMGIRKDDQIVCYDAPGMSTVARVAWMLRFFGATDVRIMNGGLQKWLSEGRPIFTGPYQAGSGLPQEGDFDYQVVDEDKVVTDINRMHEMSYYLINKVTDWQLIDTRGEASFYAQGEGAKEGSRLGHIGGSINMPFTSLLEANGCLKPNKELAEVFLKSKIDTTIPTTHTCNSGVTACIAELAMTILGGERLSVYDGSWEEYGSIEEPDFSKGSVWNEPTNVTVDRFLLSRAPEKYEKLQKEKIFRNKIKQKERMAQLDEEERIAKLGKVPLDYHFQSTDEEEISDYELDAKDIHPRGR